MTESTKKHPCQDCYQCQWCGAERCRLCLKSNAPPRLSMHEQIALYERRNCNGSCSQVTDRAPESTS